MDLDMMSQEDSDRMNPQVPEEIAVTPDPERQKVLDDLSAMGANNPVLWMALFDVSQAIDRSKPLSKLFKWESIFGTAQELYQMSFKDPREFAIAQTLMTIMHQEQAANRNSAAQSKIPAMELISSELREIREEMGKLTERVHEQLNSFDMVNKRFEVLHKVPRVNHEKYDDSNSFHISREQLKEVEQYLQDQFGSTDPDVDVLLDPDYYRSPKIYNAKFMQEITRKIYARAKQFTDPGVPIGVVVMIHILINGISPKDTSDAFQELQNYLTKISIDDKHVPNKEQLVRNAIRRSHVYCKCIAEY